MHKGIKEVVKGVLQLFSMALLLSWGTKNRMIKILTFSLKMLDPTFPIMQLKCVFN